MQDQICKHLHSVHVCQQVQIEFRYRSDSSNMKRTIWILALCIGAVLADTSEDLIDYINISNANLQCEEYCNGIFVPYEANDDDGCDDKTLEDFDDQAETPSFTSFCHTFYETTTVSTPYGGSKTEVKISNICTCGFVIFRN